MYSELLPSSLPPSQFVTGLPADEMQSLLFVKVLGKKPGWKDSNFQVMKAKFVVVATLAEKAAVFGKKSTASVLPSLVEKLADIKVTCFIERLPL